MTGAIHFVPWPQPTHGGQFWLFHTSQFPTRQTIWPAIVELSQWILTWAKRARGARGAEWRCMESRSFPEPQPGLQGRTKRPPQGCRRVGVHFRRCAMPLRCGLLARSLSGGPPFSRGGSNPLRMGAVGSFVSGDTFGPSSS